MYKQPHNITINDQLFPLLNEEEGELIRKCLKNEEKFNECGFTLLHVCAQFDRQAILAILLKLKCDVNPRDAYGQTPLMLAIRKKNKDIMKSLLRAGADILAIDNFTRSAIHRLCIRHNLPPVFCRVFFRELRKQCSSRYEMAKLMLDAGCHLHQACYAKDAKIIKYIIKQGLPINSVDKSCKIPALHVAVMLDDVKTVKVLIKQGVDVHALDNMGQNALAYVYRYNKKHTAQKIVILKILLGAGVSPMSCTLNGNFQTFYALTKGNVEVIRVILELIIDLNIKDVNKKTLLHYLTANHNPGIVEELELYISKLNVNQVDFQGMSPLHRAAMNSNVQMVKFLLEKGAEINSVDYKNSYSPLFYSCIKTKPVFKILDNQNVELFLKNNPELIVTKPNGTQVTIIEHMLNYNKHDQVKSVIAHLAIQEKLGIQTNEIISSKIYSNIKLKRHFTKYRSVLEKKIFRSLTSLQLLTVNKKKMAKYLRNKHLILKLKHLTYKQELKSSFPYYWNILLESFSKGMEYKKIEKKGAAVISMLCKNYFQSTSHILDNIVQYLNDEDLKKLCHLQKVLI